MIDSEHADEKPPRAAKVIRLSGFIATGLSILTFLLTFVALTPPGPYQTLLAISIVGWVVIGIAWLVQILSANGTSWGRWPFPALVLITIIFASLNVPFRLAFLASRGAMDHAAHDVLTGKRKPSTIHRIGLYPVDFAGGDEWGFYFGVRHTGPLLLGSCECAGDSGFVFSRDRKNPDRATLHHVSDHWYSHPSSCDSCA